MSHRRRMTKVGAEPRLECRCGRIVNLTHKKGSVHWLGECECEKAWILTIANPKKKASNAIRSG
jgi:hypothetical protein